LFFVLEAIEPIPETCGLQNEWQQKQADNEQADQRRVIALLSGPQLLALSNPNRVCEAYKLLVLVSVGLEAMEVCISPRSLPTGSAFHSRNAIAAHQHEGLFV
jgi:hypothetical protein